jgi:hypothetical protein
MSWGAGFRVYLGSSEGATEKRVILAGITWTAQERTVTTERAEYRGLSEAAAATQTPTATWTITARDLVDPSGQWVVREELVTYGAWG